MREIDAWHVTAKTHRETELEQTEWRNVGYLSPPVLVASEIASAHVGL